MKKLWLLLALLALGTMLCALADVDPSDRALSYADHFAGSLGLRMSNYGIITDSDAGDKLISTSAVWISGKKHRRDEDGNLLYWLALHPSADSTQVVNQYDPLWNPSLQVVTDTLTTVGFDGDEDLYELLPTHNPFSWQNPYYGQYNALDRVLTSILGSPAPREFVYPDPQGDYCFTAPQDGTFNTPALETLTSFSYDICPFGTAGDRDWGASRNSSIHYPLELAVRQHSYAWNLQGLDRCVIVKRIIYNTSFIDTLYDVALGEFVDCDIMPAGSEGSGAADDVSGFVQGPGWDFAYTRDHDGDNGASPNYLAVKIIHPYHSPQREAWFWKVGDGPDDNNPRSFNYQPRQTNNEKYWLMAGRQADYAKFVSLIPDNPNITEYEQPAANDTRFLHAIHGAIPTAADPDPQDRVHLLPGMGMVTYTLYFTGTSIAELKTRAQALESFVMGGLVVNVSDTLTCIPYLMDPEPILPNAYHLSWHSYTDPAYFLVQYKDITHPDNWWTTIEPPGSTREYTLSGLDPNTWYDIRVAAIYNPGPNEVYLQSRTVSVCLAYSPNADDCLPLPAIAVKVWPNPFNPSTTLSFALPRAGKTEAAVYNARGQVVKRLLDATLSAGEHQLIWNGEDDCGRACSSGVYLLKVQSAGIAGTARLLLLK